MTKKWTAKEWVGNWRTIGPILQAQRDADNRNSDTAKCIAQLDGSYQYAKKHLPVSESSGLVEFYKVLLRRPK